MKKSLIIGGSTAGGLLVLLAAAFVLFPNIPQYINVKKNYEHIDDTVPEFEGAASGDSFKEYCKSGLKMKVPDDWEEGSMLYDLTSDGSSLTINRMDAEFYDISMENNEAYDPWEGYSHKEDEYRALFEKTGVKVPQHGLSSCMPYFIMDGITAKDCLELRGADKEIFREIADIKEEYSDNSAMWKLKSDDCTAYVNRPVYKVADDEMVMGDLWSVSIFPRENENDQFLVVLNCEDEVLVKQIINSIGLDN